jgi:hypothetical protein
MNRRLRRSSLVARSVHAVGAMVVVIVDIVIVVAIVSAIAYLLLFGRGRPASKRFTDREAQRSVGEEQAAAAFAVRAQSAEAMRGDDEGPQTD